MNDEEARAILDKNREIGCEVQKYLEKITESQILNLDTKTYDIIKLSKMIMKKQHRQM